MRKLISARSIGCVSTAVMVMSWMAGGAKGDFVFGDFEDGLDPNVTVIQPNGGPNTFNGSVPDNATHGANAGSISTATGWQLFLQYNNSDKSDAGVFGQLQYYADLAFDVNVPAGTDPNAYFLHEAVFNSTHLGFAQSGNLEPSTGGAVDIKGAGTVTMVWPYRQKLANFEANYQAQMDDPSTSQYFQVLLVSNSGNWDGGSFTIDNLRLTRLLGDTNLNGKIDADDYTAIDKSIASGSGSGWASGDFNYDNAINSTDYGLIDKVYAHQGGVFSAEMLADRAERFGDGYVSSLLAGVPEPTMAAAGVAVAMLGVRRRMGNR